MPRLKWEKSLADINFGKPNLEIFSDTLLELARNDRDILAVTADTRGSGKLSTFAKELPDQIFDVGIAEQNLVGISAGLASTGKKVFAVSQACFLTARALEQVKNDVAYSENPVKLVGISAGVSYGALGSTHHSLHDLAALLAIHNIDIIVPADNFETREAIKAAAAHSKPIYIRLGKQKTRPIHSPGDEFEIGKASILSEGSDVTFVSTGEPTSRAVRAGDLLAKKGISCGVISMHSLRPFDSQALIRAAQDSRAVITVEEHRVHGGLGSLCASILMQEGMHVGFRIVGIPDAPTVTGSQEEVFEHYGISPEGLAGTAIELLNLISKEI